MGVATTESTYRLNHAEALAKLGPNAAVISTPLRATDAEIASLLLELVDVTAKLGVVRSDRDGSPLDVGELTIELAARRADATLRHPPSSAVPMVGGEPALPSRWAWVRPSRKGWVIGAAAALAFLLMYALIAGGFVMAIASGMH